MPRPSIQASRGHTTSIPTRSVLAQEPADLVGRVPQADDQGGTLPVSRASGKDRDAGAAAQPGGVAHLGGAVPQQLPHVMVDLLWRAAAQSCEPSAQARQPA